MGNPVSPMAEIIDLRSDTVTLPSPSMLKAIVGAKLGDDVFGEDPTVRQLEEVAADKMGMEEGLLVVSGTMGNLVSILAHCNRGDEAIVGNLSHIFLYEAGGISALGGIHSHQVPNQPDGTILLEDIESAIHKEDNVHLAPTRLICLENTHNRCYGAPLTPKYTKAVGGLAEKYGLKFHIDGARIFNAAVALGCDASKLVKGADSVTFCLSKGLSAPIGSVICGNAEFIHRARRMRKLVGGGMRQAGIIAAAGIVALEEMVDRLAEDHENARRLAEGISKIPGLLAEVERVKTNIIYFDLAPSVPIEPLDFLERLNERGVKVLKVGARSFRAVTHYGIDSGDIEVALNSMREVIAETSKKV